MLNLMTFLSQQNLTFCNMLDRNAFGPLVAEYEGWRIVLNENPSQYFPEKYVACNDGVIETGESIDDVVNQISSRRGELRDKQLNF